MTLLVCPLCGRSVGLGNFDPGSFDQDIYVRVVRGLGQGQGFEELGRRSALYDSSVISKVKPRLLELVKLLLSHGLLTWQEINAKIGHVPPSDGEDSVQLRAGMQKLQGELEELKTSVEDVANDLCDTAGVTLEADVNFEEDVAPIERLQGAANSIKEEYQASLEAIEGAAVEIFRIIDVQDDTEDEDPQEKLQRALRLLRSDYAEAEGGTWEG